MLPSTAYLLVEGNDDKHVIWALCKRHPVPQAFIVKEPEGGGGVEALLETVPVMLKMANLHAMGIVLDADQDLPARWRAAGQRLTASGYRDIAEYPPADGWVSAPPGLPRVGIWLIPDNQLSGMLEDFVGRLIPPDDILRLKAEAVLQEIEQARQNRYRPHFHPKALIHTWLAWQETPGMPMGQAITARTLGHDSPTALAFVEWLRRLFEPSGTAS